MKKLLIIITSIILFTSITYGQKKYVNKAFNFEVNDSLLALVPVLNSDFTYTDSLLVKFYSKDHFSRFNLIEPQIIRNEIESDNKLKDIILKILSQEYSKKELKQFPNLNTILKTDEIKYLQEKNGQADLILIPVELRFGTAIGSTLGYSRFRLYKIETGELIFDCPMDFNVNSTDPRATKNLTILLIGETSKFFRDKMINK